MTEGQSGEQKPALVTPQAQEILQRCEGSLGRQAFIDNDESNCFWSLQIPKAAEALCKI